MPLDHDSLAEYESEIRTMRNSLRDSTRSLVLGLGICQEMRIQAEVIEALTFADAALRALELTPGRLTHAAMVSRPVAGLR